MGLPTSSQSAPIATPRLLNTMWLHRTKNRLRHTPEIAGEIIWRADSVLITVDSVILANAHGHVLRRIPIEQVHSVRFRRPPGVFMQITASLVGAALVGATSLGLYLTLSFLWSRGRAVAGGDFLIISVMVGLCIVGWMIVLEFAACHRWYECDVKLPTGRATCRVHRNRVSGLTAEALDEQAKCVLHRITKRDEPDRRTSQHRADA